MTDGVEAVANDRTGASQKRRSVGQLRSLIWCFLILLIFEGALRKWILPSLATPILLIRDPLVLVIYILAIRAKLFPSGIGIWCTFGLFVVFCIIAVLQLATRDLPVAVVIFGLRTYFLMVPLIFLMPKILEPNDIRAMGCFCLWLSVPMALLMYLQYLSPPDGFLNTATANDVTQIAFEGGHVRPAGTFSFATGPAAFYSMTAAFACGLLNDKARYIRLAAWCGLFSTAAIMPVSGSRLTICMVGIVLIFGIGTMFFHKTTRKVAFAIVIMGGIGFAGLSQLPVFKMAATSMKARVDSAADTEGGTGGFFKRALIAFKVMPAYTEDSRWILGSGIGLGTSVGAALLTGARQFLLSEGEWGRIYEEAGWLGGLLYILGRTSLIVFIGFYSLRQLKMGESLSILLFLANLWMLFQGQIGQATNLGFTIFLAGLALCPVQSSNLVIESDYA